MGLHITDSAEPLEGEVRAALEEAARLLPHLHIEVHVSHRSGQYHSRLEVLEPGMPKQVRWVHHRVTWPEVLDDLGLAAQERS